PGPGVCAERGRGRGTVRAQGAAGARPARLVPAAARGRLAQLRVVLAEPVFRVDADADHPLGDLAGAVDVLVAVGHAEVAAGQRPAFLVGDRLDAGDRALGRDVPVGH